MNTEANFEELLNKMVWKYLSSYPEKSKAKPWINH